MEVALVIVGVAVLAALGLQRVRRRLNVDDLLARAELLTGRSFAGALPLRCLAAIEVLIARLTEQEHRLVATHSVTGLPTREPLAARMAEDGSGTLALLACKDYDRLCAFDAAMAERLLLKIVERMGTMLPPSRLLAQVDRSHLAIWIGPEATPGEAAAEIDALSYALGDRIVDGNREVLPEIVARKVRFEASRAAPHSAISQALASFSVPSQAEPRANVAAINLESQARERFQLEQDLRQAIARNELRMQYQPLIDAAHERVCGAEALIRWDHPIRGLVPPARFIPIAETAGLSQDIGLWAINHATRDAKAWQSAGVADLRVAVNVTGHQLEVKDLARLIARTLERHGLAPGALEIELTESVALADDVRAATFCQELRSLGVQIAIDDFGTGYSSLSALRTLPFDKIKIDRSFVSGVDHRRDSQAICSSLFALGRGLDIRVLAEGVETPAEYRWLRGHGCRYFQGFHFAPPMEADEFASYARDREALRHQLAVDGAAHPQRIKA